MSIANLLIPPWVKPVIIAVAVAAAVGSLLWYRASLIEMGREEVRAENIAAAAKQTAENATRARFVEIEYVDREIVRTKVITKIQKELPNATKSLAACTLSDDAVRLFNDAASAVSPGAGANSSQYTLRDSSAACIGPKCPSASRLGVRVD
jgi:hypothetical protein